MLIAFVRYQIPITNRRRRATTLHPPYSLLTPTLRAHYIIYTIKKKKFRPK